MVHLPPLPHPENRPGALRKSFRGQEGKERLQSAGGCGVLRKGSGGAWAGGWGPKPPPPTPSCLPQAEAHCPEQRKFKHQALTCSFQGPGKSPSIVFPGPYVFVRFAKGIDFNHCWVGSLFLSTTVSSWSYFALVRWLWCGPGYLGGLTKGKLNWECIQLILSGVLWSAVTLWRASHCWSFCRDRSQEQRHEAESKLTVFYGTWLHKSMVSGGKTRLEMSRARS